MNSIEQHIPIIIVLIAFLLLWLIGKLISKAATNLGTPAKVEKPKVHGKEVVEGVHVAELSNALVKELQTIISQQDEIELTHYFARYRPNFIELEEYLSTLRSQFLSHLGKPSNLVSESEKINAINDIEFGTPPEYIDIQSISKSDLRFLVEKNFKSNNLINLDFIERFGGRDFMENFRVYTELAHDSSVTLHIPMDHQNRKQLETFVEKGIAIQGRKIPLKDRLAVLSFTQLKNIASELKIDSQFKTKQEATETLANMPGSAVHLAMIHDVDDIFYIKAESLDVKAIEEEWSFLNAYSKLIIASLKNLVIDFDSVSTVAEQSS